MANAPNSSFSTLYFCDSKFTHSSRVSELREVKREMQVMPPFDDNYFFKKVSLLICWSPIGDFRLNFGRQIFFPLAMATKMVAAWSAVQCIQIVLV